MSRTPSKVSRVSEAGCELTRIQQGNLAGSKGLVAARGPEHRAVSGWVASSASEHGARQKLPRQPARSGQLEPLRLTLTARGGSGTTVVDFNG